MTPPIDYTLHDDPPRDDARIVDQGLGASNDAAAPLHDVRPLACFARDEEGTVVGGAVGRTWGRCCEIQQLWVHPSHRRRGIARQILQRFERRAEARGACTFYLETFSFQAPSLYRSLGYDIALAIDGYAPGVTKYTMVRFADADAARKREAERDAR